MVLTLACLHATAAVVPQPPTNHPHPQCPSSVPSAGKYRWSEMPISALALRMVGADLIVYEADWARAKEGVKRYLEEVGLGVEMWKGDDEKAVRPPWTSIHHLPYQLCAYNYSSWYRTI